MVTFAGESGLTWSYDPNSRIGDRSGFGQVFRGHRQDGRSVAVKRVPLRCGRESERRRREREVQIDRVLAVISAKYVMRLLDTGRVGDDLLLVMPLADHSLSAAVEVGDLDQAARIEALRQVASGLVELAQVPVLHRDLKPANVLGFGGRWKLADFGIARNLLESTDTYTFRGFGTLPYMAPELWAGQPATVKSDLYAFGVLAYEVLAGARPFNGSDEAALMRQHQQEAPPALPVEVPAALGRLVLRLLAKKPIERPQDARAVVETLDAAVRRLGPEQESLRLAGFEHEQWRSRTEADDAARTTERKIAAQQIEQAMADLDQIVEDAADLARAALPEVELVKVSDDWGRRVRWGSCEVSIDVWTRRAQPSSERNNNPFLLAGGIRLSGRT
jgi:serine/threonine protein kinase